MVLRRGPSTWRRELVIDALDEWVEVGFLMKPLAMIDDEHRAVSHRAKAQRADALRSVEAVDVGLEVRRDDDRHDEPRRREHGSPAPVEGLDERLEIDPRLWRDGAIVTPESHEHLVVRAPRDSVHEGTAGRRGLGVAGRSRVERKRSVFDRVAGPRFEELIDLRHRDERTTRSERARWA